MHNPNFQKRFDWEYTKHKEMFNILSKDLSDYLNLDAIQLQDAPMELDTKKSTDVVAIASKKGERKELYIAARIRKPNCKYRELTIRKEYYGSSNTEVSKLHNAHYYFVGFTNMDNEIKEYMIVNIKKLYQTNLIDKYKSETKGNKDDDNKFFGIPAIELINNNCVVKYKIRKDILLKQIENLKNK